MECDSGVARGTEVLQENKGHGIFLFPWLFLFSINRAGFNAFLLNAGAHA